MHEHKTEYNALLFDIFRDYLHELGVSNYKRFIIQS